MIKKHVHKISLGFVFLFTVLFPKNGFSAQKTTEILHFTDQKILYFSTVAFVMAILHTLLVKKISLISHFFSKGSVSEKILHFLGEVEIVFGFWAFIFVVFLSVYSGTQEAVSYVNSVNFSEAVFVFVIMCMCATKPIVQLANDLIEIFCKIIPASHKISFFCATLIIGPLLGSFITEPAAMTVIALLLKEKFFNKEFSQKFKYAALGLLFVNVSIGGTLSNFAAPPILVVSEPWGWSSLFMLKKFGLKSLFSIVLSTICFVIFFRKEFENFNKSREKVVSAKQVPIWLKVLHCAFIGVTIGFHSYVSFYLVLFLFFLGWHDVTKEYQHSLKIKESLLVGFFLGGLVTLGGLQGWWLEPFLSKLSQAQLFLGATALTAFADNAAITYLATLVPDLSEESKYAIVSGAVAGGGLTVIANAPNPSGYGILKSCFGEDGISPLGLFLGALPFTILAMLSFVVF